MKVKATVWCTNPGDEHQDYYVCAANSTMETIGWYLIARPEIEFEEPTRAMMMPSVVAALEKQKEKILAEAQKEVLKIEDTINKLCALEN